MANIAINATAEQIEKMANMGIDDAPAQDSANLVTSGGVFSAVDEVSQKADTLDADALKGSNADISTVDGKVKITKDGEPIGTGFDLPTVDADLNEESTNAVQNKAVASAVNGILTNETNIKNNNGGFQGGNLSKANGQGVAIGNGAQTGNGFSGGASATSNNGVAAGVGAQTTNGVSLGTNSYSENGVAIGEYAASTGNAIQIGEGYNETDNTVQFFDYPMLDENGKIPAERLNVDGELKDSQNPVSNSAVFNEFSKMKNLELLTDITLEEDTRQVSLTQTQDGRPLNLNRVFVYFVGETTTDDHLVLRYNSGKYIQLYYKVGGESRKFAFWLLSEKLFNGTWISKFPKTAITSNISSSGGIQGLATAHRDVMSDISILNTNENVTSVVFGHTFSSDSDLKAGSRILIYGENNE